MTQTTVSDVKVHMKELVFFIYETAVIGQGADLLQHGYERLAELFGISIETIASGEDNVNQTSYKPRFCRKCAAFAF